MRLATHQLKPYDPTDLYLGPDEQLVGVGVERQAYADTIVLSTFQPEGQKLTVNTRFHVLRPYADVPDVPGKVLRFVGRPPSMSGIPPRWLGRVPRSTSSRPQ